MHMKEHNRSWFKNSSLILSSCFVFFVGSQWNLTKESCDFCYSYGCDLLNVCSCNRKRSYLWLNMGKKGSGWFSSVKKVFKHSPKDSPEKKVSSCSFYILWSTERKKNNNSIFFNVINISMSISGQNSLWLFMFREKSFPDFQRYDPN